MKGELVETDTVPDAAPAADLREDTAPVTETQDFTEE